LSHVYEKSDDTTLTPSDLEEGSSLGPNKWLYAYVNKYDPDDWVIGTSYSYGDLVIYNGFSYQCIQSHTSHSINLPSNSPTFWEIIGNHSDLGKVFLPFLSDKVPSRDQFGNIIDPGSGVSKYHPTRPARFVGSIRLNSSSQIVQFILQGSYVAYVGQGANYFLQNGGATSKLGINCRTHVPPTSQVANIYYQFNPGSSIRYMGDSLSWYVVSGEGSGSLIMPITSDNIYYRTENKNHTVSLGVFGFYEEI